MGASASAPPAMKGAPAEGVLSWDGIRALGAEVDHAQLEARLGLDRARTCISSTAPISRSTLEFFFSLGLPIHEVYGMTECTGPATAGVPGAFRIGSAGRPIPGMAT